jgi:hypothetical protein
LDIQLLQFVGHSASGQAQLVCEELDGAGIEGAIQNILRAEFTRFVTHQAKERFF